MDRRTERELYERELRRDAEISRENANANGALMVGLFLVAIAALGAVFFVTTRQSETQAPQQQTPDINIELPERQAPQVQPPDVNINVPEVNVPEVTIPEVNAPEVSVPEAGAPSSEPGTTQQSPTSGSPQQ
jgi:hypothetical protein